MVRHTSCDKQFRQPFYDSLLVHIPGHVDGQALPGKFIENRQNPEQPSILTLKYRQKQSGRL